MTNDSTALATSLAYFQAWTGGDFEVAMTHIDDDVVCQAPAGRLQGAEAFRNFMGPFSQIVTRAELVAGYGDDSTAVLVYDTDTVPVQDAPGAECHTVVDGKITNIRIIFDRQPFTEARQAAANRS
jgi:hypothetical protein